MDIHGTISPTDTLNSLPLSSSTSDPRDGYFFPHSSHAPSVPTPYPRVGGLPPPNRSWHLSCSCPLPMAYLTIPQTIPAGLSSSTRCPLAFHLCRSTPYLLPSGPCLLTVLGAASPYIPTPSASLSFHHGGPSPPSGTCQPRQLSPRAPPPLPPSPSHWLSSHFLVQLSCLQISLAARRPHCPTHLI